MADQELVARQISETIRETDELHLSLSSVVLGVRGVGFEKTPTDSCFTSGLPQNPAVYFG